MIMITQLWQIVYEILAAVVANETTYVIVGAILFAFSAGLSYKFMYGR